MLQKGRMFPYFLWYMSITYFHKAELFLWTAELFLAVLYSLLLLRLGWKEQSLL